MKDWKLLPEPYDRYEVSSVGEVRRVATQHVLKQYKNNRGYAMVHLNCNKPMLVHRLVALAFLPNPENKRYVDHINTVRDDNRVSNLRWVTCSENVRNEITARKRRESITVFKTPEFRAKQSMAMQKYKRPVLCIETGERWDSVADAARALQIPKNRIYLACKSSYKHSTHKWQSSKGETVLHFKYEHSKEQEQPERAFGVRKNSKAVMCVETGQVWQSIKLASVATGLSSHYIQSACSRAALPKARPTTSYKGKAVMHFHYI